MDRDLPGRTILILGKLTNLWPLTLTRTCKAVKRAKKKKKKKFDEIGNEPKLPSLKGPPTRSKKKKGTNTPAFFLVLQISLSLYLRAFHNFTDGWAEALFVCREFFFLGGGARPMNIFCFVDQTSELWKMWCFFLIVFGQEQLAVQKYSTVQTPRLCLPLVATQFNGLGAYFYSVLWESRSIEVFSRTSRLLHPCHFLFSFGEMVRTNFKKTDIFLGSFFTFERSWPSLYRTSTTKSLHTTSKAGEGIP